MNDLHAISSYGPTASSTRVRLSDWFRFLRIDATHHNYAGLNNNRPASVLASPAAVIRAEFALRRLDLRAQRVIISREASPFSLGDLEERLLRRASLGVYDFDDALLEVDSTIRRLLRTKDKCQRATAAADVVIVGNDYLANWAQKLNKDVRVIPSCIDPRDYVPKTQWSIAAGAPSLVWLGSPATEGYVAQIIPALLEVHRKTDARLTVISGPQDNPALAPLSHMLRRVPWSIDTFASNLASADVAIAPLDDSPFSRGKCAYKLLQYAATGLPIVGSPVGANELALQRFNGLQADCADDWVQGLLQVLTDTPSQRAVRAAAGRTGVGIHYSFDAWKTQWQAATGVTEADRSAYRR
jgi:glycosyltransferase involved in cell wall biosynthesis